MKPSWNSWQSNSAADLLESPRYAAVFSELREVLTETPIPFRPIQPFSDVERKKVPKRQSNKVRGVSAHRLLPIDQPCWNEAIKVALKGRGWTSQPLAVGTSASSSEGAQLVGDFTKGKVFVEVEFGNSASYFRDLLKFEIANKTGSAEVAVLVTATKRTADHFDSGVATFESIRQNIEPFLFVLRCPILFVGLDYREEDVLELRNHYDAMYDVATSHGVRCHPSSVFF